MGGVERFGEIGAGQPLSTRTEGLHGPKGEIGAFVQFQPHC